MHTGTTANGVLQAIRRNNGFSPDSLLEYAFSWAFQRLVYPQIWEDPEIDMEALALTPRCHVVAIASGGCNILSYLIADPQRITAVDLNRPHIALNRLKLAAAQHLPSWRAFYRFFGEADDTANVRAYWRYLAPQLDAGTRRYWEQRGALGLGRRRVSVFSRNIYRHGLLGRFIGLGHMVARAYGVDPRDLLRARSMEDQRRYYATALAPLFDKRFVRWVAARQLSLYGLGIPPAQYAALAGGGDMAAVLRERVKRLSCGFSIADNYFAWQAFGRTYADRASGPLPPYLRRQHFEAIRSRVERVKTLNASITDHLRDSPARSADRYVLLDAQDWMTDGQLNALWREITRTARPNARVIFRTAAAPSLLPDRLDRTLLSQWRYEAEISHALADRDRSAIYGGFHLYVLNG